jgi:hypothetical protein
VSLHRAPLSFVSPSALKYLVSAMLAADKRAYRFLAQYCVYFRIRASLAVIPGDGEAVNHHPGWSPRQSLL